MCSSPLYIQTPPHVHIFFYQIESLWEAERKQAKPSVVKVMLKMVQDQLAWGWTLGGLDGLITCVGRQVCSAVQNTPCPATSPNLHKRECVCERGGGNVCKCCNV